MNEPQDAPAWGFESRSVGVHLARGVTGLGLGTLALYIHEVSPVLALGALIGAVVLLRGCPMCWIVGLVETLLRRGKTCAPCAVSVRPEHSADPPRVAG
ncbi:MAG TPA: hypothetical protein VJU61_22800 [Polyangiaceae bacterium]|nr:hypothetical protein [Polyangiaceae bacterium]